MPRPVLPPLAALTLLATTVFAGNSTSSIRATLDSPLSEQDIRKIKSSEPWPHSFQVTLRDANDEIPATLTRLSEMQQLALRDGESLTNFGPLGKLQNLAHVEVKAF